MVYFTKKGSILIAMLFAIVLSITAVSFFFMIYGRTTLMVNQPKRKQAINCAEAALYEAFNRFRAGDGDWVLATFTDGTVTVDGVNVAVTKTGASPPYQVSATVDYDDITM